MYNVERVRCEKTVNGSTTKYYLEGTNIVYEEKGTRTIYYFYDATGVIGLKYNNSTYLFEKNLQGDIIGIVDSLGEIIVTYEYDSWGKVLSIKDKDGNEISNQSHVGIISPFRYRGYYYDNETGLYYLNSRYYNPEWCRFINADEILGANQDILSYNLYAYVSNNPIAESDVNGYGLFKKIGSAVMNVRIKIQQCKTAITNAVKDVFGRIISVDYTKKESRESDKKIYTKLVNGSIGTSTSSTKTILGNKNSVLKINITNNNNDIGSSTISTSMNLGNLTFSSDYGLFSTGTSLSISYSGNQVSYSSSLDHNGLNDTISSGTESCSSYVQFTFGWPILAVATAGVTIFNKIPIPDIRTVIRKTGQIVGSAI